MFMFFFFYCLENVETNFLMVLKVFFKSLLGKFVVIKKDYWMLQIVIHSVLLLL